MLPYLLAGAVFLSLFGRRRRPKAIAIPSSPGVIFKCNSLKLTDKTKFHDYLKIKIKKYISEKSQTLSNFEQIDFIPLFLKIFEQLNKTCYSKFTKQQLTSTEKIVIFLLFSEIADSLKELVFSEAQKYGLQIDDPYLNKVFDQKLLAFSDYLVMWMNAKKEMQDFPQILEKFGTTYQYP